MVKKLGKYELNKIYQGDSIELVEGIPDGSIDLLLTDPPYNVSSRVRGMRLGNRTGHDFGDWDYGFDTDLWTHSIAKKIADNGQVVIFNGYRNLETMARILQTYGFTIKENSPFWYKTNPIPGIRERLPVNSTEGTLWAVKGDDYTFNNRLAYRGGVELGTYRHSSFSRQYERFHTTQKPLGLFQEIILVHSNPEDIVLDTFSGSGVTSVACEELGRNYIGFELGDEYFSKSKERLERTKKKPRSLWSR